MSRPASEYTQAIRNLLDEKNGELTHAEARPLLAKLGFDIAAEPPSMSDAFSKFDQYEVKLSDAEGVAKAMTACEFDPKVQKTVLREAKIRAAFKAERNNFDVTKYNWAKMVKSGEPSPSRKPVSSKNTKAKAAAALPQPKHRRDDVVVKSVGRPKKTVVSPNDDLAYVTKHGGVSAVRNRIAELRAEADKMESAVNSVLELQKRIKEAA